MRQAQVFDINKDKELTYAHLAILERNKCLVEWYKNLWEHICKVHKVNPYEMRILEIGSGASPLKKFAPQIFTTDILKLPWLDFIVDAHKVDELSAQITEPFDVIILTHVLHHLNNPLEFLQRAAKVLKPGGRIIMAEPFYSQWGHFVYKYLHYESMDLNISKPLLPLSKGPLSDSNQALPFLLFFKRKAWRDQLEQNYDLTKTQIKYFGSFSYVLSGGFSRKPFLPHSIYKYFIKVDRFLATRLPKIFAFTFTCELTKKKA